LGPELEAIQIQPGDLGWRWRQTRRGWERLPGLWETQIGLPEGGKDPEGFTGPGSDLFGLLEQPASKTPYLQLFAQFLPEAGLQSRLEGFITAVEIEGLGLTFASQGSYDLQTLAPTDD